MSADDIVTIFAVLTEEFPAIVGQPTDAQLFELREALYEVLLDIEFDRENGVHDLTGLMDSVEDYELAHGGASFPTYVRVGVYDKTLAALTGDDADGKRRQGEATHRAKLKDWESYSTVAREGRKFLLSRVEDMWVRELKDPKTKYSRVKIRDILDHLQSCCLGTHAVDVTSLREAMTDYHTQAEDVFQYINMLEDARDRAARIAQRQGKTRKPIVDEDLLDTATTAHIKMEQFPRANEEWEDLLPHEKTWAKWKGMYKAAENKARVKVSASGENSFGGAGAKANAASTTTSPPTQSAGSGSGTGDEDDDTIIEAIEAGFDNIANAAKTDQNTLTELVKSNAALTESNKTLTTLTDKLQKKLGSLESEVNSLRKKTKGGGERKEEEERGDQHRFIARSAKGRAFLSRGSTMQGNAGSIPAIVPTAVMVGRAYCDGGGQRTRKVIVIKLRYIYKVI